MHLCGRVLAAVQQHTKHLFIHNLVARVRVSLWHQPKLPVTYHCGDNTECHAESQVRKYTAQPGCMHRESTRLESWNDTNHAIYGLNKGAVIGFDTEAEKAVVAIVGKEANDDEKLLPVFGANCLQPHFTSRFSTDLEQRTRR
jgi:hypothetical protein